MLLFAAVLGDESIGTWGNPFFGRRSSAVFKAAPDRATSSGYISRLCGHLGRLVRGHLE